LIEERDLIRMGITKRYGAKKITPTGYQPIRVNQERFVKKTFV